MTKYALQRIILFDSATRQDGEVNDVDMFKLVIVYVSFPPPIKVLENYFKMLFGRLGVPRLEATERVSIGYC